MKNKTIALSFTLLTLVIGGNATANNYNSIVQESQIKETETIGDNSANSLDWNGTYQGIIPCVDCQGIEISLTLNQDMSFVRKMKYIGKSDKVKEKKGKFTWNKEGNTVILGKIKDGTNKYFVGENMVIQLDKQGNKITGNLADKYILNKVTESSENKQNDPLFNTRWNLTELRGQKVVISEENNQIFLKFNSDTKKLEGFGGCNNFFGSYEIKEGNRLIISQIGSTRKACETSIMDRETELFKVLEMADNYHLENNIFMLHKAKMAPLAKFEPIQE